MLVISRKIQEKIVINNSVVVTVIDASGDRARLGFEGDVAIPIHRQEIYDRIVAENGGRVPARDDRGDIAIRVIQKARDMWAIEMPGMLPMPIPTEMALELVRIGVPQ